MTKAQSHEPEPMTSAQLRAARGLLGWTVRDLAEAAGVHRNTVTNFETGRFALDPATEKKIRATVEAAGVEFIPQNGGGAGVRLKNVS